MQVEHAIVVSQTPVARDYRELVLHAPGVACAALPGQFIHLRVPRLAGAVLRRPFSIHRADGDHVSVLYKKVGRGTEAMADLQVGEAVNLIGPLGNGFPPPAQGALPVLVAGGYGVAPLSFLAQQLDTKGVVVIGGATADDLLCVDEFEALAWPVVLATEDGTRGARGMVTDALDAWWEAARPERAVCYACGPDGMLRAVGERATARGIPAWLSLDTHMGCGVGACLACVQRIRAEDGTAAWKRVCRDGPVFESATIVWEAGHEA